MAEALSNDASAGVQPAALERSVVQVARGVSIILAGRLFGAAHRFVLSILLARLLGAEQYGLYNLALTAATVTGGLALLGMDTALVRYVAAFASRRDEAGLWGVLLFGGGVPGLLSLGLGVGLYALAGPVAEGIFHEPAMIPLLRLAGLLVPCLTLMEVLAAATRGFKIQHYTVLAKFIWLPIVKTAAILGLALIGLSAERAVAAQLLGTLVAVLLLWHFLNREFSLRRPLATARHQGGQLLSFSLPVYASTLLTTFDRNFQALFLGAMATATTVGIYALAAHVSFLGKLVHSSIITAAMPIIAELDDRRASEQLERFYRITTRWSFALNLPLFLVLVLFPEAFLAIFGQSFLDGSQALAILAWASLVATATGTNGALLDMTGHTRLKLVNALAGLLTGVLLNVILIPRLGILGAACAALATTAVIESLRLVQVYLLLRMHPYDASFLKPIAAGLLAVVALLLARPVLADQPGYVPAIVGSSILLVVYASVLVLAGLEPQDRAVLGRLARLPRVT